MFTLESCPIKVGCYCDKQAYRLNPYDWSFVPLAFCLSLINRSDRFEKSSEEFHRVGLCTKIRYLRTPKDTLDDLKEKGFDASHQGHYGAFQSHKATAQLALEAKADRCLIFEDDVVFARHLTPSVLFQIKDHLRCLNWDIYYLGHSPRAGLPIATNLFRVWSMETHAYIQNRQTLKRLANIEYNGTHIDTWIMQTCQQYAFYPSVARQSEVLTSDTFHQGYSAKIMNLIRTHPKITEQLGLFWVPVTIVSTIIGLTISLLY